MAELILALDESTPERALDILRRTSADVGWYKVGYEAYYAYGDRILSALRDAKKSIFLDLKLHDIPTTVAAGVRAAAKLGADLLTVHAAGGSAMLSAAAAERDKSGGKLRLMAVTVLTSMTTDDLRSVGIDRSVDDIVVLRARLAARCGLDGVVCAVAEAAGVREAVGPRLTIVCPGVRLQGDDVADQRRVATPADAVRAGANFIVAGRSITRAPDPVAAVRAILDSMKQTA